MEYAELNSIANIVSGYAIPSSDMTTEGTAIIKITNIREDGTLDLINTARYNKPITDKLKKFLLRKKDIVVCMTGATIGKVARILKLDQDYIVNQRVAIIRAKNQDLQDFVFHLLTLPTFRRYVEIVGYGAAQPNISASAIGKYKFLNSGDILQQRRIASILSAYDNLIENNTRRIRLLEQMAENLYKEWFVRFRFPRHEKTEFENGLPKGWKVERVKEIVKRLPFNRIYKGYELEKMGNVIVIDQSTDEFLGFHNNEPSHYADYDAPLIIFGDHSCKFQLMTRDFSLGENVIPYTTYNQKEVNAYWLFYATRRLIQTEEYKRHWGRFTAMKVLIPDYQLQQQFEKQVKAFEKEKNLLSSKNALLSRQRDLLLPRLMSGKLEVKQ